MQSWASHQRLVGGCEGRHSGAHAIHFKTEIVVNFSNPTVPTGSSYRIRLVSRNFRDLNSLLLLKLRLACFFTTRRHDHPAHPQCCFAHRAFLSLHFPYGKYVQDYIRPTQGYLTLDRLDVVFAVRFVVVTVKLSVSSSSR